MSGKRRLRRLVVGPKAWLWSVHHRHGPPCSEVLSLHREGAGATLRLVFRAGPGRFVADGYGYAGSVYLMGWTGGYVLLALLLAPYLRKFGKYTIPDFVGDRYSESARLVAVVAAIVVSFVYVAGQMGGVGIVFQRFLGVERTWGVVIGMVIVFFYAVLGGMKGITWTQVAQVYGLTKQAAQQRFRSRPPV